jgi:O-antigen/teichoic acid export membrane protein
MAINLVSTATMARLVVPGDYGISVLGGAILSVAEAVRGLGGCAYLIQEKELTSEKIRSCFSVSLVVTIVLSATLVLLSGPLTRYFLMPELGRYLQVAAVGYMTGPFAYPAWALMSRSMLLGPIAAIGVAAAAMNAVAGVALAWQGFGYMSFAWAGALSAITGMLLFVFVWRDISIYRPSLRGCRAVIAFGAHDSATAIVSQVAATIPYFIFGRLWSSEAVGLSQRAVMLCLVPERVILAGVGAVALPAFSRQVREGLDLKGDYLRATELITAALWPALLALGVLAGPIVAVLLGREWRDVAPLVEILTVALLFSFPASLQYPTLVAAGAIRYMPPAAVLQSALSLGLLYAAARHGLEAAAFSMWLIVPVNGAISFMLVQRVVGISWQEMVRATRRSALCAGLSALGSAAARFAMDGYDMPLATTVIAVGLAGCGWLVGLRLTDHPMLRELVEMATIVQAKLPAMPPDWLRRWARRS